MKIVSAEFLSRYARINNKAASAPSKITSPAVMILIACSLNGHIKERVRGGAVMRDSDFFVVKVLLSECVKDDILYRPADSLICEGGRAAPSYVMKCEL